MSNDNPLDNGFCNKHSGVTAEIRHCQHETDLLNTRIKNLEEKVDKIVSRLTYTAITFALMAVGLFANLALKAF